jgi:hypothetical protein
VFDATPDLAEDGTEPLSGDEIVYRRIVELHIKDPADGKPMVAAFRPTDDDIDGLSFTRAKYSSKEAAARGRGLVYWTVSLRVQDVWGVGLSFSPDPLAADPQRGLPAQPGHCLVREIRVATRDDNAVSEWRTKLAKNLSFDPSGPYRRPATTT